jgi:hypothetical protein
MHRLLKLFTKDLSGRTWTREADHPYLGRMTQFCAKDASRNYWEAEVATPQLAKTVCVTFRGTETGPDDREVAFCRATLGNPDALFEKCRGALAAEFAKRIGDDIPENWQTVFQLNGFGVPVNGDPLNDWDVCYFSEPEGRYFSAYFERRVVARVVVDG